MKSHQIISIPILIFLFAVLHLSAIINAHAQWRTRVVTYSGQPAPGTNNAVFSKGFLPFSSAILSNSGRVYFSSSLESGIGDGGGNEDRGIWLEKDGVLSLFVRSGKPIPNSNNIQIMYDLFSSIDLYSDQRTDKTMLMGNFSSNGVDFDEGFITTWDNEAVTFHELKGLTPYPAGPDGNLISYSIEGFNNGIVLIDGYLQDDDKINFNNSFLARYMPDAGGNYSLFPIVRGGEPMVGAAGQIYRPAFGFSSPLNFTGGPDKDGQAAIYAVGNDADFINDSEKDDNIYSLYKSDQDGNLSIIKTMMQGEQKYIRAHTLFNSSGEMAFIGYQDGFKNLLDLSIWVGKDMDRVVASYGDKLSGITTGDSLKSFAEWSLLDDGRIIFYAGLSGNKKGIWMEDENKVLQHIAMTGKPLPNSKIVNNFDIFHYANNPNGTIAFRVWGTDEDNKDMQEIWVGNTEGLERAVSTGDTIEVANGDKRVVAAFTLPYHWATNTDSDKFLYSAALNSKDELLIDIEFTDGSYAVIVANSGFVVNSTADDKDNNLGDGKCECDGPLIDGKPKCTLRAAIMEANQTENKDKIRFDIPTDDPGYNFEKGTYWIWPQGSSLDEITKPVIIDGTSQKGFDGSPIIVLDGTDLGINAAHGLSISGGNSEIRGLVITNFIHDAHGIHLRIKGGNLIKGNYIGVDPTGSGPAGMGSNGIFIDDISDNVIGGTTVAARNIVSDNDNDGGTRGCGILIKGSNARNNIVLGNYIGTDVTGTIDIGNPTGVCIEDAPENTIGGDKENALNLISGNSFGITIIGKTAVGNKVQGNYIGTKANGIEPLPNGLGGIQVTDAPATMIGGETNTPGTAPGNLISGNKSNRRSYGISFFGADANGGIIQGNLIGVDNTGTKPLPNGKGVMIISVESIRVGGANKKMGNIISGNDESGIFFENASKNFVQNNVIGADIDGLNAIGNKNNGIRIAGSSNNIIGGDLGVTGNVISGNIENGILFTEGSSENTVKGNLIGTDINGQVLNQIGNNANGVRIVNAESNIIGGDIGISGNVISGNLQNGVLIETENEGDVSGNIVKGNLIGTDITGLKKAGNMLNGVKIQDGFFNKIGMATNQTRNIISGNGMHGIYITGESADANEVSGNYIGTNIDGNAAIPNTDGVVISNGATGNNIGGPEDGEGNVISANNRSGIFISGDKTTGTDTQGNVISGNYIGTDAQGKSTSLGNTQEGVLIFNASGNYIGGNTPEAGNIITDNLEGVAIVDTNPALKPNAEDNHVEGNVIGVDIGRIETSTRMESGVVIENARNNFIGGNTSTPGLAPGNLIAYNLEFGVHIINKKVLPFDGGNIVEGNIIGFGVGEGRSNGIGVCVENMDNNTIEKNRIHENKLAGVVIRAINNGQANSNKISQNDIFQNFGLGIDLDNNAVTPNDPGDEDTGANGLQNFPVITGATTSTINGKLASLPNTSFTVELFANSVADDTGYGEGEIFLTSLTVATNENGDANFFADGLLIAENACITATATNDGTFDTSEFSECVALSLVPPIVVNSTGDGSDTNTNDGVCATGNTNSEGKPECTLRAAIQQANASLGPNVIQFAIPGMGPHSIQPQSALPEISDPVFINGISQPGFTELPLIEIDGSQAGDTDGLHVSSGGSRIVGLAINNFERAGIALRSNGNNAIFRNFIGTDITGNEARGNGGAGIILEGSSQNTIGATDSAMLNIIAHNGSDGVLVLSGKGNAILVNSIHTNNGLGINLSGGIEDMDGRNENDFGDEDTGANNLQNYPELMSVSLTEDNITVNGTLNSSANTEFLLLFFSNAECDASAHGEGEQFVGTLSVTTDPSGNADFSATLPALVTQDEFITCTATNLHSNSTSEFSACINPIITDIHASGVNAFPDKYYLYQSYPNPFNSAVTIEFDIKELTLVTLKVFNIQGKEVATLVNEKLPAGYHSIQWDASNKISGMFFYKLTANEFTATKRMLVMK